MSKRHLAAKVQQQKEEKKKKSEEDRKVMRQKKDLRSQVDRLRAENRDLKKSVTRLGAKRSKGSAVVSNQLPNTTLIERHKYSLRVVSLCMSLYFLANCSFRGVSRILHYFQLEFGIQTSEIPCKSTISNWTQKSGYYYYSQYDSSLYESEYGLIIDESMVIGQERMMVALGIPAVKESKEATVLGDVRILAIEVKASWKGTDVTTLLDKVSKKMGKKPLYVISDGGNNLKNGIHCAGLLRICDIGHEVSKLVEQTYSKDETFVAFTKAVAGVKFREVMKGSAYLLPPKQRSIARFMNFSTIVNWARKMLAAMPKLSEEESKVFGFLNQYKVLITELSAVYEMTEKILKKMKNEGISHQNIEICLEICKKQESKIPQILKDKITKYLEKEKDKIPNAMAVWNVSSDILESLFGKYKNKNATNTLHGVTPLVLSLCSYAHFDNDVSQIQHDTKEALETVFMSDLKKWKSDNLVDNQVVRRNKILKK